MIEKHFDIPFIADLALREKQIQQNYRPIITVHKWFARRPGTLFRGLLLSEFSKEDLAESFYRSNQFSGLQVADPFMGGGIPLIEANRLGCDITGYDINPMAYWIVRQEIEHVDLDRYMAAAAALRSRLEQKIGGLYRTKCLECQSEHAQVKYFLWIKVQTCKKCGADVPLFPGYMIARNVRHPENVFVCALCNSLNEVKNRENPGNCHKCSSPLLETGFAKRGRCQCPECDSSNVYPDPKSGPPRHRMFAIEYHCPSCRPTHKGRFFKRPDDEDYSRYMEATAQLANLSLRFVPDEKIPHGDEANRLHRWGYRYYREMFNDRQLLGLELSCRAITAELDERIRNALATNLSDLLRYQNMLCRYDTMALKSLDIFSVHGFPVGLVQCESNLVGVCKARGGNVGSGGWSNIIDKYRKAKAYCDRPFEVRHNGKKKVRITVDGEWIGDKPNGNATGRIRKVDLHCQSATLANFPQGELDAVLTDPPYYGNVQYAELMDFCYVWLRRLVGVDQDVFSKVSTRDKDELTNNITMERGSDHFAEGLSNIFSRMAAALKPGAPLAFTYHHNKLQAYYPVAVAILDSGLTCSASLPSPAEMGASIHISGTGSSIIDTIFVCRSTGSVPRRWLPEAPEGMAALVREDLRQLRLGGVKPTQGDVRCILFGHLIRLAVWSLRTGWKKDAFTSNRLSAVSDWIGELGGVPAVERYLEDVLSESPRVRTTAIGEPKSEYGAKEDEVHF